MADVSAIFGVLLITGIAFPGLLAAWRLLFPATVERARLRIEHTPWPCFWLGGLILMVCLIPIIILLALPFGPAKFFGWLFITAVLSLSSLGSAGIAAKMSERIATGSNFTPIGAFLRSAVILELAILFPVLGWLFAFPLTLVTAIGATGFSLLRWSPRTLAIPILAVEYAPTQAG